MTAGKSTEKLDRIVAHARRERDTRLSAYREKALTIYPWICGRCCREFKRENLSELTVHHRDHNHDNNPSNGSNWELLCVYCHENEHSRLVDVYSTSGDASESKSSAATYNPFANLADILKHNK